jgi:predicted nuclease with RNAse H fold
MSVFAPVYIGINPTSSRKEFCYAVIDPDLNLVEMLEADTEHLVSLLAMQESALVAINAPSRVNQGLLKARLAAKDPKGDHQFRGVDIRLAEYELRQAGISVSGTPAREELCPGWMQAGFGLYRELSDLGYLPFPEEGAALLWIETHPYACFCALLDQTPFPQPTLEGRLQRQLILHEKGLRIGDPMDFFEEITRFKLLNGVLPLDTIYTNEQLDVLVAAFTAWVVDNQMDAFSLIGDRKEGYITVPVKELKEKY